MTYAKQTWADGPAGGTPINAAALTHIEDGIEAAHLDAAEKVSSTSLAGVEVLTYEAYGALTPDAGTLYLIQGADSAVAALGYGDSPLVWLTGLLIEGNFQSYLLNPYSAHTSMWGLNSSDPVRDALVADSSMRVTPHTFPDGTVFAWDVTPDPDVPGVQGFLHVDYGNYDWSPGVITPRQVYTITDLDVDVAWTLSGDASSGLLSECWLSPTEVASGEFTKSHEIGFFPRSSAPTIAWLETLPELGSFEDSNGVTWEVRESVSATGEPYFMACRPGYGDFEGALPYADFFAFLIGEGKITGNEWVNGVAFGVEPQSGSGSLTVDTFRPAYAGAARVPWTVSDLVAGVVSDTEVALSWTPAAGATSHQYRINGGSWLAAGSGAQAVTGLTPGAAYTFQTRGVNATGNGAASNTAAATMLPPGKSNLIVNGGFADDTGWDGAWFSGKTISGGKANFTASPEFDGFGQAVAPIAGKYYELTWTISGRTSGIVYPRFTGGTTRDGVSRSANGTFTERLLANTGNDEFEFLLDASGTLSVDDISLVGPYDTATVGGS